MNRTEDDLRAVYTDPPGIEAAERRLIDSLCGGESAVSDPRPPRGRRGTWAAAGAGVAVAAVAVGTAVIVPHLGSNPAREPAGGAPATKTSPHRQPAVGAPATKTSPHTAGHTAAPPHPATARVTITPQVAAQTLIGLLPRKGTTSHLSGQSGLGEVSGELVYDDGQGAAEISVMVSYPYRFDGKVQRQAAGSLCDSQGVQQLQLPCTTLRDGSQMSVYQGDANIPGGATEWSVELLRPDGVDISVSEWNSPIEKGAPQTRTDPPFTVAELEAIVRSTQWQSTVTRAAAQRAAGLFTPQQS